MRATTNGLVIAPALLRIAAFIIDGAILLVFNLALIGTVGIVEVNDGQPANAQSLLILMLMPALYHIGFTAAKSATLGKSLMNIYVAYPDGSAVRPDTAILRYVAMLIGNLLVVPMLISLVILFANRERRTLHDRVAGTVVLAGRPGAPLRVEDIGRPR